MTTEPQDLSENEDDILELDETQNNDQDVLSELLASAQKEAADFKDKFVRAVAEMDNLRKRAARDVEDAGKYGVTSSAKPFLSVADNLDRALQSLPAEVPDNLKTVFDGIRATQRELHNALDKMGVVAITPKTGEHLNPHEHEVMFEVPSDDQPNGTIMQVLENGYKIHDRLLRPARVAVSKNSNASEKAMDISA